MNPPQFLNSVYIHGEWASHLQGKVKSFSDLFWTIGIPWDRDPYKSVNNFVEFTNQDEKYIGIASLFKPTIYESTRSRRSTTV